MNGEPADHSDLFATSKRLNVKKLWDTFSIELKHAIPRSPYNKVYATINVEPDYARELIDKFKLRVDNIVRGEFSRYNRDISLSGFPVEKGKAIAVLVEAISIKTNETMTNKQSNLCKFHFTEYGIGINPLICFQWNENKVKPIVTIVWDHIGDHCAPKYSIYLNDKEIQHINNESIHEHIKVYLHNLQSGTKHVIQIIAKLSNGTETYRSDRIEFSVPKNESKQIAPITNISNETVLLNSADFIKTNDEHQEQSNQSISEHDKSRLRAMELYQLLCHEIVSRKKILKHYT
ncbi:hypothetical protein I4U23_007655 [Adineta vaga]|nr:hypothetical protein I4U23_007655 [Adineta vaga]